MHDVVKRASSSLIGTVPTSPCREYMALECTHRGTVSCTVCVPLQAAPAELKATSSLRFGASTRTYALQQSASGRGDDSEPAAAKARVHFADGSNDAAGLEQVIGYSDSRDFAVSVGPTTAGGKMQGQFAAAVSAPQTIQAGSIFQNADQLDGLPVRRTGKGRGDSAALDEKKRQRKPQPLQPPMSSGLFDMLPPETSRAEHAA